MVGHTLGHGGTHAWDTFIATSLGSLSNKAFPDSQAWNQEESGR